MATSTLELLSQKIEERRIEMLENMGDGNARDFAQYQHAAGIIRGFLVVQSIIADLAKAQEFDDD